MNFVANWFDEFSTRSRTLHEFMQLHDFFLFFRDDSSMYFMVFFFVFFFQFLVSLVYTFGIGGMGSWWVLNDRAAHFPVLAKKGKRLTFLLIFFFFSGLYLGSANIGKGAGLTFCGILMILIGLGFGCSAAADLYMLIRVSSKIAYSIFQILCEIIFAV